MTRRGLLAAAAAAGVSGAALPKCGMRLEVHSFSVSRPRDAMAFLHLSNQVGEGVLDMAKIGEVIRTARPETRMSLEMITRDPLNIPCLTENYWKAFPDRNGRYLARMLSLVQANKPRGIPFRAPANSITPASAERKVKT